VIAGGCMASGCLPRSPGCGRDSVSPLLFDLHSTGPSVPMHRERFGMPRGGKSQPVPSCNWGLQVRGFVVGILPGKFTLVRIY